jgi:hypothetical protein
MQGVFYYWIPLGCSDYHTKLLMFSIILESVDCKKQDGD